MEFFRSSGVLVAVVLSLLFSSSLGCELHCPVGVFSFGDSLSDPGNHAATFPEMSQLPANLTVMGIPYRQSNGKLLIDFIAQAFGHPNLEPYFQDVRSNYTHGVNFAFASATARNTSITVPFYLSRQVNQFSWFKDTVNGTGYSTVPPTDLFSTGLYWISIGVNDFWENYYYNNYTIMDMIEKVIPDTVLSITQSIERLYGMGARTFLVMNVPAMGCVPLFADYFKTNDTAAYDAFGCLKDQNDLARYYGFMLRLAIRKLRYKLPQGYIMYGDYFQMHYDAVADPQRLGLNVNGTTKACCPGSGRPQGPCGNGPMCQNPDGAILWDDIHFAEGFNRRMATMLLQGKYVEPSFYNLQRVCGMDLENLK